MSWIATATIACTLALGLEVVAVTGWMRPHPTPAAAAVQAQLPANPAVAVETPAQPAVAVTADATTRQEDSYYAQLRSKIHWVETRIGSDKLLTPDDSSRMLLAKSAAERANLQEVGLSFKDVYGIINAETSWIPRMGASKDGTPNLGLAQFEPATARALGLRNPNDPVEAIHVAALHMKEAAEWSANRIAGLKLGAGERAQKLREGVSIFYNLSTKGRNRWNGKNTAKLPIETQLHIRNARSGALFAAELEAKQPAAGILLAGG
ncbi:hypothetical protein ACFPOE_08670 [Caenimonas terrae]|uniref:Lytic transglycosylase domain-containing protein n=1 Tax=Caenimonas terrae TaxID=696074 RepID=A0ABW0NES5_9BURK